MLNIDRVTAEHYAVYAPPPDLTVSQWADEFRRLSSEASAEPGRWNTDRAPYQRGILDAINDPAIHTIVVMSSAQVGKTEILLNIIGYYVDQDPAPMLCLQPTLDMAEAFSKDRLAAMVRDTPALNGRIADPRSRDSGNTLLHKKFAGGHITLAGSNSPASLASRPCRIILCDEVDRYPVSAAAEGDPVNLAKKRSTTFWNKKLVLTSTPTIKGFSRIETAYLNSDRRTYLVECPHCQDKARLTWERVKWPKGKPEEAAVSCLSCGVIWTEQERKAAIAGGEWSQGAPFKGIAGFHLSEIYSPWSTPAEMAVAFIEATNGGVEMLQTWTNTALGESWEEKGETIHHHSLMDRCEQFTEIPEEVKIMTMGVDVQADRIEGEIVGWGSEEECWSLDYVIIGGDPSMDEPWNKLEEIISSRYSNEKGRVLNISATCIDSGYLTKRVYEFCRKVGTHVMPVKGMPGFGRPIVESGIARLKRLHSRRAVGVKPEMIGVDEAKITLYRRLMNKVQGPGYCHFPVGRDEEYFAQLTSEKLVTRFHKGRPVREWIPQRARNEALDCRVYAHAALLLHGVSKLTKEAPKEIRRAPVTQMRTRRNGPMVR